MDSLRFIKLSHSRNLIRTPDFLEAQELERIDFEMETLEIFSLSGCSKVKKIPEFTKNMERLRELHVNGTAIVDLPSSIEHLTGLSLLNISHCKNLVHLPCAIL